MPSTTSIDNYHLHQRSGKLGDQEQAVLDFLAQHPGKNFSRSELSEAIALRLSSVCGRVNKLLELGLISERSKRACSITGKTISPVRIVRAESFQH